LLKILEKISNFPYNKFEEQKLRGATTFSCPEPACPELVEG